MWMLLHGFTGSPESWDPVVERAALDQEPLRPTLLGHGRGWRGFETQSFDEEVARLALMLASLDRPRCVGGYSLGARLALGLLATHPHAVDAALLIGVHPGLRYGEARRERREVDAARAHMLREEGLAPFVRDWEALPLFFTQRGLPTEALARQRELRLGHDAQGLARSLEVLGLGAMPDYDDAFIAPSVPITVLAGARDSKFARLAEEIGDRHARIEAHIVNRVGHNLLLEAPETVALALRRTERRASEGLAR